MPLNDTAVCETVMENGGSADITDAILTERGGAADSCFQIASVFDRFAKK